MKQYQQILIAAVPTIAALTLLSPHGVVLAFLIVGDAHILTAYLYQYRAGKMTVAYQRRFLMSVAVIGAFLLLTGASLPLLTFVTAVVFVAHFIFDEIYLLTTPKEPLLVFAVSPVFLLYVIPLSDKLLGTSLSGYAVVGSVVCVGIYLLGTLWRRTVSFGGLWMVLFGLTLLTITFYDISSEKLLATVILFHYARWLVFYADKYWKTPRFAPYIRDVLVIQTVVAMLFVWYALSTTIGHVVLALLFTQTGLYVLTLLHVFTTGRSADYQKIIRDLPYALSFSRGK